MHNKYNFIVSILAAIMGLIWILAGLIIIAMGVPFNTFALGIILVGGTVMLTLGIL